jgi:hypothetical protein
MTFAGRQWLMRVQIRLAQEYGRALAEQNLLDRSANVPAVHYRRAALWVKGCYHAWLTVHAMLEGQKVLAGSKVERSNVKPSNL